MATTKQGLSYLREFQKKMKPLVLVLILLSSITLPIDQLTKHHATSNFIVVEDAVDTTVYQGRRELMWSSHQDVFWITLTKTYVRNHGASWGIWSGFDSKWRRPFLVVIGLVATLALFYSAARLFESGSMWPAYALCGVIAGALGNIVDRVRLGYVVDFLNLKIGIQQWTMSLPSFNLADIVIVLSLILLMTTISAPMKSGSKTN